MRRGSPHAPPVAFWNTAGADPQLLGRAWSASAPGLNNARDRGGHSGRCGRTRWGRGPRHAREDRESAVDAITRTDSSRAPRCHANDEQTMKTGLRSQGSVQHSPTPGWQWEHAPRFTCARRFENHSENQDQNGQCASVASPTCYRAQGLTALHLSDDRGSKGLPVRRSTTGTERP